MSNADKEEADRDSKAGKGGMYEDIPLSTQHDPKFWIIIGAMIVIAAALYMGYWVGSGAGVPDESPDEVPNITSQTEADQGADNIAQGMDELSDTLEDLEELVE
ncbi:hypothetical protein GF351_04475 [Candidatus Woesearchaeota archaeon]|nr:hypothetical protein [Candidatus Woesearchaeota archaeon]